MFVMTPEMTKHADKQIRKMLEEKKKEKEDRKAARDARLKSLGLENCDEYFVQKLAEVKQIAGTVEKEIVKEAKKYWSRSNKLKKLMLQKLLLSLQQ